MDREPGRSKAGWEEEPGLREGARGAGGWNFRVQPRLHWAALCLSGPQPGPRHPRPALRPAIGYMWAAHLVAGERSPKLAAQVSAPVCIGRGPAKISLFSTTLRSGL